MEQDDTLRKYRNIIKILRKINRKQDMILKKLYPENKIEVEVE